jgi:large subunit ribosomal protein L22
MLVKAVHKYAHLSPWKAVQVARVIRCLPALEGLDLLRTIPRKAARLYYKVLHSAIANAQNNHGLNPDRLIIAEAAAESGPSMRRFNPGPRGQAMPIKKRMTHLKIIVSEQKY